MLLGSADATRLPMCVWWLINQNKSNAETVMDCFRALTNIAFNDEYANLLGQTGAIQAVLGATLNCIDQVALIEFFCAKAPL